MNDYMFLITGQQHVQLVCLFHIYDIVLNCWSVTYLAMSSLHTLDNNNNDRLTALDPGQPG